MSHWNWYVARPDEIFCDLDSKKAIARAFHVLRRAVRRKMLDVHSVYFYPSERHQHLIVRLNVFGCSEICGKELRALWALWMGSDRLRGVYVLERLRRGVEAADVLSTRQLFKFRPPDARCHCPDKHKRKAITDNCPAMKILMMDERSGDYFPRNFDRKKRVPFKVPYGKVPKKLFMKGC